MDAAPLFVLGLPILLVLPVGLLGLSRRVGFWGAVLLSLLLTPIGGLVVAVLSGQRRVRKRQRKPLAVNPLVAHHDEA